MTLIQQSANLRDGVYILNIFASSVDIAVVGTYASAGIRFNRLDVLLNYMRSIESFFNTPGHSDDGWIALYYVEGESFSVSNLRHLPGELGVSLIELTNALFDKNSSASGLLFNDTLNTPSSLEDTDMNIKKYEFPCAYLYVYGNRSCRMKPKWCLMLLVECSRSFVADALWELRRKKRKCIISNRLPG